MTTPATTDRADDLAAVLEFHHSSKHQLDRYAPGPGQLDWANQPDPFRSYSGTRGVDLMLAADALAVTYSDLRRGRRAPAAAVDRASIGVLLEISFGLSAWKQYGDSRWALRCNPSSGNLHPTECYVITAEVPELDAGLYHYLSRDHRLEQRASVADGSSITALAGGLVIGLSTVHWREAWKYGLRAFRYCQHDCGHAIAALALAAAALGWRVRVLGDWGDEGLSALLGLDRRGDFVAEEPELPEVALWIGTGDPPAGLSPIKLAAGLAFHGSANRLSARHLPWPGIDAVHRATQRPDGVAAMPARLPEMPELLPLGASSATHVEQRAVDLIRQRRSAVDFDGVTSLAASDWYAMLDALLPRPGVPTLDAWDGAPRVQLLLFVHRVDGVAPGLYILLRESQAPDGVLARLRAAMRPDWSWVEVPDAPGHLPLYRLATADVRDPARAVSCHQAIASDSCFAVAMLAEFDDVIASAPWRYRELFWECGMLGQSLYLEAEAAGVRGTGIGCFFDDAVHQLLGIEDTAWQSLYHFTVGGPVEDDRLQTQPPYRHLDSASLV